MIDPKPPKRIKATPKEWAELRAELLKYCAICGTQNNLTLHHVLPRSLGGDDTMANLYALCGSGCTGCHGDVEARKPKALSILRSNISQDTLDYLERKKDDGWIDRHLPYLQQADPQTKDGDNPDQSGSPGSPAV